MAEPNPLAEVRSSGTVLLVVGAVYGGFHYGIDMAVGVAVGLVVSLAVIRWRDRSV